MPIKIRVKFAFEALMCSMGMCYFLSTLALVFLNNLYISFY